MVKIGKLMGLERPSTDSPSYDCRTPPHRGTRFIILGPVVFHCRTLTPSFSCIASYAYASLYSTTLFHTDVVVCTRPCLYLTVSCFCITGGHHGVARCMPRICLNCCGLLIAESTERRALILGSPSFAISQKPRTPRRSFYESTKLRRYAEPKSL